MSPKTAPRTGIMSRRRPAETDADQYLDIDDTLGKRLRSSLRQIVTDARC